MYNPDVHVVLVVDEGTDKTLTGFRSHVLNVVTEKRVVKTPPEYNNIRKSRFLKTTLRNIVEGDFLYIDCDTVITDSLDEIDAILKSQDGDLWLAADRHCTIAEMSDNIRRYMERGAKLADWTITNNDKIYFNGGVMLVRDSKQSHDFFKRWNELWTAQLPTNLTADQPSLARTNQEFGYVISELDGIWNCQIASNAMRYVSNAKIIHSFASNISNTQHPYYFMNQQPYLLIKKSQEIPFEVMENIRNAKTAFSKTIEFITKPDIEFVHSWIHDIYIYHRPYYNVVQSIASAPLKLIGFLKGRKRL